MASQPHGGRSRTTERNLVRLGSVGLALSKCEAADALGVSVDFLEEHVMHELRVGVVVGVG